MKVEGEYITDMNGKRFWVHNTDNFFGKICHQIPERSFFIKGTQMLICARCTGLYIGIMLGILFLVLFKKIVFYNILLFVIFDLLLIILEILDFYIRRKKLIRDDNITRFFVGVFGGIGLGNLLIILFFIFIRFINSGLI